MTIEVLPILVFFFIVFILTILITFFFKKHYALGNLFIIVNKFTLLVKLSQFDEIIFSKDLVLNGLNLKFSLIILAFAIIAMILQEFDSWEGYKKNIVIMFISLGTVMAIGASSPLLFFLSCEVVSCGVSYFISTSRKDSSSLGALRYYVKSGFFSGVFLLSTYFLFISSTHFSYYKIDVVNYNLYATSLCLYLVYGFSKIGLVFFNSKLVDKFEYLDYQGIIPVFLIARAGIIYAIIEKFQQLLLKASAQHQPFLFNVILFLSVISCFYMGLLAVWAKDLNKAVGFVYMSQLSLLGVYLSFFPSIWLTENLIFLILSLHVSLSLCVIVLFYLNEGKGSYRQKRWRLGAYSLVWGALSLIGLPPSLGVISRVYSFSGFIKEGHILVCLFLIIGLCLSINLIGKIFKFNFDSELLTSTGRMIGIPLRLKIVTMLLLVISLIGFLFFKSILEII